MFRTIILHVFLSFLPLAFSYVVPRADYRTNEDTRTICIAPAPWNQILSFFVTNYAARVLTFKKASGYSGYRDYINTFQSLFVPFKGISDAANTIARGSRFLGHDDLDRALLARALCVVVRNKSWRPENGEIVRGCIVSEHPPPEKRKRRRKKRRSDSRRRKRTRSRSATTGDRDRDYAERGREGDYGGREYGESDRHYEERDRDYRNRDASPRKLPELHYDERDRSSGRRRHDERDRSSQRPRSNQRRHNDRRYDEEHLEVPLNPSYLHADDSDDSGKEEHDEDSDPDFPSTSATLVVAPLERNLEYVDQNQYKFHGSYTLPPSYEFVTLPPGASVRPLSTSTARKEDVYISNSYGVAKSFTGAIQIISSLYALYSAYGEQTLEYGYAAFGFSVLPYTVMSLLNAIANLIEASYDTLYLVRSDVMLEAERRERGEIVGEIAELVPAGKEAEQEMIGEQNICVDLKFERTRHGYWRAYHIIDEGTERASNRSWKVAIPSDPDTYVPADDPNAKIVVRAFGQSYRFSKMTHRRSAKFRTRAVAIITVFALLTPYIVIGAISKFSPGNSDTIERVFMMGWLVVGQAIGALNLAATKGKVRRWAWWSFIESWVRRFVVLMGFAFAIGGFYYTARNLRDFGYCMKLGGL